MACFHWVNPLDHHAANLRERIEARDGSFVYEHFMNYAAMGLLADTQERGQSTKREDIIAALEKSAWDKHFMPYQATQFINGQNQGAGTATTPVQNNDIKVIGPTAFCNAKAVSPAHT